MANTLEHVPPEVADVPPEQLQFLASAHGIEKFAHGGRGQNDLRTHLTSVRYDLKHKLQCADVDLQAAALFHSVYGTEGFQGKTIPLDKRPELKALIGERGELTAYVNCVMQRSSFDAAIDELRSRRRLRSQGQTVDDSPMKVDSRPETGQGTISLSELQLEDLMRVHLADWQQNVESCNFYSYRRPKIAAIAATLGGLYAEVYADRMSREDETKAKEVPEMVRARQLGVFDKVMSGEIPYSVAQSHDLDALDPQAKKLKTAVAAA